MDTRLLTAVIALLCLPAAASAQPEGSGARSPREEAPLPNTRRSSYARALLARLGLASAPQAAAERADRSAPRGRRTSTPTRTVRPGRTRRLQPGMRGALEGERSSDATLTDPDLEGTAAEEHGTIRAKGPLFARGPGDAHAIDPDDLRQGQLGDCYLLAALAAIARSDPDVIRGMVRDNEDGTYTVRLFEQSWSWLRNYAHLHLGQPLPGTARFVDVIVTPDLPSDGEGDLAFSRSSGDAPKAQRELWPHLIEKAYAELRGQGSYQNIVGGHSSMAFNTLTGSPAQRFRTRFRTPAQVGGMIRRALRAGYPVTIDSRRDAPELGIFGSHAYTVMGTQDGRFVLRNPWGNRHPTRPLTAAELRRHFGVFHVARI